MTGYRVLLGVIASAGIHVGSLVALSQPALHKEPPKRPAAIELAPLPPPPPKLPEVPLPPPEPPKPAPQRLTKPAAPSEPPREPPPRDIPVDSPPVVLAGLSMSNAGIGVPNYESAPTARSAQSSQPVARSPETHVPAPSVLTPVSDLSRKPVAPSLDTALARFYPAELRNQGVEGEATIRVVLAKDGKVAQTSAVSESHPGFAPACEKALRTSKWEAPVDKSGNPTMTALKYRCRFRVNL